MGPASTLPPLRLFVCFTSIVLVFLSQANQVATNDMLSGSVPAVEIDALLHFKAYLSSISQAVLNTWDANTTSSICSTWVGVTCGMSITEQLVTVSHIYAIQLQGFGLAGSLAPHLGNLSYLSVLNLSNNSLSGSIPPQLSSCTSLQQLVLINNSLTGSIPSSLTSLSLLRGLGLCINHLRGRIPQNFLANFTSLEELSICENALEGPLPTPIPTTLNYFIAFSNSFTGAIPRSLGYCADLNTIELGYNQLTGAIPAELGLLTKLAWISLEVNGITGPIPRSLGNCSSLTMLDLNSNELTGSIPMELGSLAALQVLYLLNNSLTKAIPSSLGNCTNLLWFDLQYNQLMGTIPKTVTQLGSLQYLHVNHNLLTGFELLGSSNLTSLYALRLEDNQLSGIIPPQLGRLQQLQRLDLSVNAFSHEIPWDFLSNCSFLYRLSLAGNHLSGGISKSLQRFHLLQILQLQDNWLHGSLPEFESSSNLSMSTLDLSFNQLHGILPASLADALGNAATEVDFSFNDFSGYFPPWFGRFVELQFLSLSHNRFVGALPDSLGECEGLNYLDLSHNHFSGELPSLLSNLTYIRTLDLSVNNFSGELPPFLGSLHNLRVLNVSFNNFTGRIPPLGVLKHINASSFEGNPGLCGLVIHKVCNQELNHGSTHKLSWKVILAITASSVIILGVVLGLLAKCARITCCEEANVELKSLHKETKKYTAEELLRATDNYAADHLLGQGGLAAVYKAELSDGEVLAVKLLKEVCSREQLLKEMHILRKLRHRNLVHILGCVLNLEVNALVLEYMPNGSLEHYLHLYNLQEYAGCRPLNSAGLLSWRMIISIAIGVANALTYLHHEYGEPIIHGDVKPSNILLDSDMEPHLADFGLAKLVKDGAVSLTSNVKGTIGYLAPEYAYALQITTKVDVYSFGVVLLEMVTGERPTQLPESASFHEWVKGKVHNIGNMGLKELLNPALSEGETCASQNDHMALQLLQIGVACTENQPNDRPAMHQISRSLANMKINYIDARASTAEN